MTDVNQSARLSDGGTLSLFQVMPRNMYFGASRATSIDLCVRDLVAASRHRLTTRILAERTGDIFPGFNVEHLIRDMDFTRSMTIYRRSVLKDAIPLPAGLVSCQDLAILFPVLRTSTIASIDEPVCFNLKGAPNQLSANYALILHQTIRITQHFADLLSPEHKKAALLKAAKPNEALVASPGILSGDPSPTTLVTDRRRGCPDRHPRIHRHIGKDSKAL